MTPSAGTAQARAAGDAEDRENIRTKPPAELSWWDLDRLAEEDGAVVGFALFFHNYSTFLTKPGLYLEDLFVRPEHRGRGHGKALLAHLARLAVERGCGRFEWAVLHWNAPAIAFYKSFGAVPQSEWNVYRLTGDALKRLAGVA